MSSSQILVSIGLGLLVNEFCEVSPWAARHLVRWAARARYQDTPRATVRTEEWARVIDDRPGKLFKLITALFFAVAALVHTVVPARHTTSPQPPVRPGFRLIVNRVSITFGLAAGAVYMEFNTLDKIWGSFPVANESDSTHYSVGINFSGAFIVGIAIALGMTAWLFFRFPLGFASATLKFLFSGGYYLLQYQGTEDTVGWGTCAYFACSGIGFGVGVSLATRILAHRKLAAVAIYVLINVTALILLYSTLKSGVVGFWKIRDLADLKAALEVGMIIAFATGLAAGLGAAVGRRGFDQYLAPAVAPSPSRSNAGQ